MTAEIAILNKSAVALAADSKVTLNVAGRQKTYDTVDKLFSLSKTEPVRAMIYGNAEFMGFPWETVLKEYRRQEPHKKFETVFGWADDLRSYLTKFFEFRPEDEKDVAFRICHSSIQNFLNTFFTFVSDKAELDKQAEALKSELETQIGYLQNENDFFSETKWKKLESNLAEPVKKAVEAFAEQFGSLSEELESFARLVLKKDVVSDAHSGLVVAGFGEEELLPSLVAYSVDGILGGELKCRQVNKVDISRRQEAAIVPFAQTDMIYRFMEGIDPQYAEQLNDSFSRVLLQNAIDTAKAVGKSDDEVAAMGPAFREATTASVKAFDEYTVRLRAERFSQPIIDMTMRLPKDELSHLAESLLNLTSLQRRVSREIETVGGAIDVAVISKGDGFVWIKRKHYFNADRNLRFVQSYFSEYNDHQFTKEEPGRDE